MAKISPFTPLLPNERFIEQIASKPYDVLSHEEAKQEIKTNPKSYLNITRADSLFDSEIDDLYGQNIYDKAKENLDNFIKNQYLTLASKEAFYIYQLKWRGRKQTGLVALSSVQDYHDDIIKKHELTRVKKENDRINHMFTLKAQTGNVFLAYKDNVGVIKYLEEISKNERPIYHFFSEEGEVENTIWAIYEQERIHDLQKKFKNNISTTYIADGHHRVASACKLSEKKNHPCRHFVSTLFATKELQILPYHRVLRGFPNFNINTFREFLENNFEVQIMDFPQKDLAKKHFGLYHSNLFYLIKQRTHQYSDIALENLDSYILQTNILEPFFKIENIRIDERVDFIGGIRGNDYIKKLVDEDTFQMTFLMPAIDIDELISVSDNNDIMPPKSTWFEPKIKDGIFTNLI